MPSLPQYRISALLERDANNLDLIRLICAVLVIYGHAFAIAPSPEFDPANWDPFLQLNYAGTYSGSIAVKVFFFISGLLVANSLLSKASVSGFIIARFCRIWPALFVTATVTAFVIGPFFSAYPPHNYFGRIEVYNYVFAAALLHPANTLPAVFADHPLAYHINGTLWTLGYEFAAYLVLLIAALLGVLQRKWLVGLILIGFMVDAVTAHRFIPTWFNLSPNPQIVYLAVCFASGAFLAIHKHRVVISPLLLAVLVTGFFFLRKTDAGPLCFLLLTFATMLYCSALSWLRRIHLSADISYGLYLWGFVVQQMFAAWFPGQGPLLNFVCALTVSAVLAWISWHVVEKPALRFGRQLTQKITPSSNPTPTVASGKWALAR